MKLVYEDEHGVYLGVKKEFLKRFVLQEINPNFQVYDSQDNQNRFIVVKSSRIPDDEDLPSGRYGIDFNRAKPTLQEALQYKAALPSGYQWAGDIGFAAGSAAEYNKKSAVWESFYSYIWGEAPQTVWTAPHSGSVNRPPDDTIVAPKLWIDRNTAGVAALCAYHNSKPALKRTMICVHATGLLGAVLNLGDFGVLNTHEMDRAAKKIEVKYHARVQSLAGEFKQDFCEKTSLLLEHIYKTRGTLNPEELGPISKDDRANVVLPARALSLYGQEIKEFTLAEFEESYKKLGSIEVPVISNNYLYTARHISELLKLREKIAQGLMYSALNVECAKLYAAKDPELVSDIILDVINELFNE